MIKRRQTIEALAWYLGKTFAEAKKIYKKNKTANLDLILEIVNDYQNGIRKRTTAEAIA